MLTEPRTLTNMQQTELVNLARQTMAVLELWFVSLSQVPLCSFAHRFSFSRFFSGFSVQF
jgi:hypothetical protein